MSLVQICNGLHIFKAYIKLMMADSCMILENTNTEINTQQNQSFDTCKTPHWFWGKADAASPRSVDAEKYKIQS